MLPVIGELEMKKLRSFNKGLFASLFKVAIVQIGRIRAVSLPFFRTS
jgi:hypothetical protein